MELCHRNNRFEVAGITFPLNAFVEENDPSEEYLELELIASSLYDLELGLEKTKRLHESKNLVAELELPTPTPEARPDNFSPQLADTFPTPPNGQPGDRRIVLRPPQPAPIPPQPQPQPVPPQPAPPREIWAANVGIHYEMVQHPNGGIGARITRVPPMGSPASQIWVWGQLGWLQPNDIILAVDGIPIQRVDFAQHFGQTRIDFIDGPTGLTLTGIMLLP